MFHSVYFCKGEQMTNHSKCTRIICLYLYILKSFVVGDCAGLQVNSQEKLTPHKYFARDFKLELQFNRKITRKAES